MQTVSILAVLALAFTCTLAFDAKLNNFWTLWKNTHNKVYSAAEDTARYVVDRLIRSVHRFVSSRAIWEGNLKTVQSHNLQADLGVHTYWLGMNKYADLVRGDESKKEGEHHRCSLSLPSDHHRIRPHDERLQPHRSYSP